VQGKVQGKMQGLIAVLRKELLHLRRDPFTLVLAFVLPIVQAVGFGMSVGGSPRHIPLAVLDEDRQALSRRLVADFEHSSYFEVHQRVLRPDVLSELIDHGEAKAALHIPPDFNRDLEAGRPVRVQLILDGLEIQYAQSAVSAASSIAARLMGDGTGPPRVEVAPLILYNREFRPQLFVISGLLALILTQCGIALASLTLVREKEMGSYEQLIVTPVTTLSLIVGKMIPYALISAVNGVLIVALSMRVFDFPFRGSVGLFCALSLLFFLAVLGYGLLISALARNALQAILMALLLIFPPIFFSGFDSPFSLLPTPLKVIGSIFPMTFYLDITRSIMVRGLPLDALWYDIGGLLTLTVVLFALTAWRFRKTLG
jgi:ABC-2 type transport system permease protein